MGQMAPPLYGESKFYEKKKQKAIKEIAKLTQIIEECDKEIAKRNEK